MLLEEGDPSNAADVEVVKTEKKEMSGLWDIALQ